MAATAGTDGSDRAAQLGELAQRLALAESGRAQIVFLAGERDSGKSALLGTFARDIAWKQRRIRALLVRPEQRMAYDPVAQAARDLEGRVARGLAGANHETTRRLFTDWAGAIPVVGNLLAAVLATTEAVRRRRRGRAPALPAPVARLLQASRARTLVLIADDIERAAPAALNQLELLVQHARAGHRLFVVASCPPAPPAAVRDLRGRLHGDDACTVRLDAPRAAAGAVTARMIESVSLDGLGDRLLPVLRAASRLGERFDSLTLAHALGRDELDIEDVLAVGVRQHVIAMEGEVAHASGESATQYRFTSVLLRAALDQLALPQDVARQRR